MFTSLLRAQRSPVGDVSRQFHKQRCSMFETLMALMSFRFNTAQGQQLRVTIIDERPVVSSLLEESSMP